MNIAVAALATLLTLAAAPALAVGFERVTVPDPAGPPLEAGIWYPSEAPASPQPLGLFVQTVATGAPVAGRGLPLVVMSHGTGGTFEGHYDTALALAEAGFVVASITHTGDNYRDQSAFGRVETRPRHIKALIDYMLAAWPRHDVLDPSRVGMHGFSAGGFTALAAIGGVPDMVRVASFCAAHPDDWACNRARELRRGGKLVLANFCIDEAGHYLGATVGVNMFDEFARHWRGLLAAGRINEAEYVNATFQQFYKTPEEFAAPFRDANSSVSKAGLRLGHLSTIVTPCPYAADHLNHRDAAAFAKAYVPTLRSWSETVFAGALDPARPADKRAAIINDFYEAYEADVARTPNGHRMDYVHCLMEITKVS